MIILDTSVWIEFLRARPGYFDEVKILLERGGALLSNGSSVNSCRAQKTNGNGM